MRIFLILFLMITTSAHAFDWDKCDNSFSRNGNKIYALTEFATSSGQITTSTGSCSLIGEISHDKKVFISQNFNNLQTDSAIGEGEYLSAYAILNNCNIESYSKTIKSNYKTIFKTNKAEDIYNNLESYTCKS